MATSIDDNAADEQSGKSMCQLFIIRCTSLRQEQSISGAEKARKSTCLDSAIPSQVSWGMRKTPEVSDLKTLPFESVPLTRKAVHIQPYFLSSFLIHFLRKIQHSIQYRRKDTQYHDGHNYPVQFEYLTSIDNQISKPFSRTDKFSNDNSHKA